MMNKEKALEILKNNHLTASWTNDQDETWSFQIGDLFAETPECFIFVVYPHSTKVPLDLNYAFLFYVMKNNGFVSSASSPMTKKELKEVNKTQ
jgi:hypothetical protein